MLEQTSNVPAAPQCLSIVQSCLTAVLRTSHTRHPIGNHVAPSRSQHVFRHVRHGSGDPAAARRFTCPFHLRRQLIVQRRPMGGGAVIPRPVVWGLMAIALPRSRSPVPSPGRFGHATTRYVDHPQAAMGSRHRSGTAPGSVGDRPHPTSHPRRRSNSNHAGKSTHSSEIESRLRPGNCDLPGINIPSKHHHANVNQKPPPNGKKDNVSVQYLAVGSLSRRSNTGTQYFRLALVRFPK